MHNEVDAPPNSPSLRHRPLSSPTVFVSPSASRESSRRRREVSQLQALQVHIDGTAYLCAPPSPSLTLTQSRLHSSTHTQTKSNTQTITFDDPRMDSAYQRLTAPLPTHSHSHSHSQPNHNPFRSRSTLSTHSLSKVSVPKISVPAQTLSMSRLDEASPSGLSATTISPHTPMTPRTPQHAHAQTMSSEQTLTFDADRFLNERGRGVHRSAHVSIPDYDEESPSAPIAIALPSLYNMSSASLSHKRSGLRTTKASEVTAVRIRQQGAGYGHSLLSMSEEVSEVMEYKMYGY